MEYLMMRLPEIFEMYKDGLITQSEALWNIQSAVVVSIGKYMKKVEEVLFEKTGKRPYSLGL